MGTKYNIGDIFKRPTPDPTYMMIVDFMCDEGYTHYEFLILNTGEYDWATEGYFSILERVA